MSCIEYRRLLEKIESSLEEFGITKLLYWCKDKIQARNQHNIHNVHALFEEMEANNTLGIDRLENLNELLRVLEKWRLFKEVRKFEIKRKKYNDLLQQISEAVDESIEMERLISICRGKILAEREGNINDTRSLFRELEIQNNLEFRRLDILKEILNSVRKEDLLREVEDFERWRNDEDESACRGGERAVMFAHARSLGGRVFGVLTMKTICQVGAAGITLLTVHELLKRSDTYEQLMASFTACVLPAGTQLMDISHGCVCFTIKADNLAALCTLWNMYRDGTLKLRVKNFVLSEEMIKLAGGEENVEVTVTIEEEEYEKASFEFIREQGEAKPRKTIRRNSDSALSVLPNEDDVSLVKMKQLETAFKLQQERIASLEKEVHMLPNLFLQAESPQTTIEKGDLEKSKESDRDLLVEQQETERPKTVDEKGQGDVDEVEEIERDPLVERIDVAQWILSYVREKILVSQHPDISDIYYNLAALFRGRGDLDDAERYLKLALESKHPDVAVVYFELAAVRREKGDLDEAERYLKLSLDIRKEKMGSKHPDVAAVYYELAAVRREKGDLDETERYLTLALDIRKEKMGCQHPDVAAVYYELAAVRREKGDLDEAERYLKLSLDIWKEKMGSKHPDVAAVYYELAAIRRERGDVNEAELYLTLALDIWKEKLGYQHLDVAAVYYELAAVRREKGELDEAERYLTLALNIQKEKLGSKHPNVAVTYYQLAAVCREKGDLDEAEGYLTLALDIREEKLGSKHPDVTAVYYELAAICRENGDLGEAERYLTLALDIQKEKLGSKHPDVAAAYHELAAVCREKGDLDRAELFLTLALDIRKEKLGHQHLDVGAVYYELGAVRRAKRDLDEAERYLTLALDIRKEKLGSKHPNVAAVYYELAAVHRKKGDLDEAEGYLTLALDIQKEKLGSKHPDVAAVYQELAAVCRE